MQLNDVKSNTILFHQLWLLQQLNYWISLQHEILTPWNQTNAKNLCIEIQLNLPHSLVLLTHDDKSYLEQEFSLWSSCEINLILQKLTEKFHQKSSVLNVITSMPPKKLRRCCFHGHKGFVETKYWKLELNAGVDLLQAVLRHFFRSPGNQPVKAFASFYFIKLTGQTCIMQWESVNCLGQGTEAFRVSCNIRILQRGRIPVSPWGIPN